MNGSAFNVQASAEERSPGLARFNNPCSVLVPLYQARVLVHLRPSVLDPAGEAARAASARLGVDGVERLRIGKAVELELEAPDEAEARRRLELLSDRLLANPVIENWTLELEPVMSIGVIVFPGSNCDRDVQWATEGCLGMSTRRVWHEETDLSGFDAIVLPGGFSYGDYLRCGAIARFAPALQSLIDFAAKGGRVLGICNGFQVLTELGLLPGALTRNQDLHFICEDAPLKVVSQRTAWMQGYNDGALTLPIAHGEGRYQCSDDTLKQLQDDDAIALSYGNNPNGSVSDIAGITNASGSVLGLMPHPERACDPATGGTDGRRMLEALLG